MCILLKPVSLAIVSALQIVLALGIGTDVFIPTPAPIITSITYKEDDIEPLWRNYRINEIYVYHGCDTILSKRRPIHNQTTWNYLHQTYENIVGKS